MLDWLAPAWLAGLVLLPAIWWLHRLHRGGREVPVAALFLWAHRAAAAAPGRRLGPADPAWRRRALLAALLLAALAGPTWTRTAPPPLEVWVDDSASLYTQEAGGTRMALALIALQAALEERPSGPVTLRALSDPARGLASDGAPEPARVAAWLAAPGGKPRPPPPATLSRTVEHWLVTDGADTGLARWLEDAPIARVIRVGERRANLAVTRLALRPAADAAGGWAGLAAVYNAGDGPATASLTVSAGRRAVAAWKRTIHPKGHWQVAFHLPPDARPPLTARLTPADALALDDRLDLQGPWRQAVRAPGCGRHLRTALAAHPGLEPGASPGALAVSCGPQPPRGSGLWLRASDAAQAVQATPLWHPAAGMLADVPLEAAWLRAVSPTGRGRPVLEAGGHTLVALHPGPPRRVEVNLDLEHPDLAGRPEYPVLVAGLLDLAAGRPLLETVHIAERSAAAAHIAPQPLPTAAAVPAPAHRPLDLAPWLIAVALPALLPELRRRARRSAGHAPGTAA